MNLEVPIFTSTLVLTALLPVSVFALYVLIRSHVQLAADSPMASAIVGRFDSEAERAAYHADVEALRAARRAAVMNRYGHCLEEALANIDPRMARVCRAALMPRTATAPPPQGGHEPLQLVPAPDHSEPALRPRLKLRLGNDGHPIGHLRLPN